MLKSTTRVNLKMTNAKSRKLKVTPWSEKVKNGKQNSQFKILEKCHKATIRIKDGKLKSKIRITIKATLKAEDGNPEREKSGAKIGNKYGIPFGRKRTHY